MPILITKQEALDLLRKWKGERTRLSILFELHDETGKTKLIKYVEGLALAISTEAFVTDFNESCLRLKAPDARHSIIVSLEGAVFGYAEPRDLEGGLTEEELEHSRKIERSLRIVVHQHGVLYFL